MLDDEPQTGAEMASASVVASRFRVDRSVDGDVTLIVKTFPAGHGDWGLFVALAAGLYLTAVLGSFNPNVRSAGQPVLLALLGVLVLGGLAFKIFVAWAARKTSGSVTISPRTRTMSHQGLQALFPWQQFQLPSDAGLVLDAVTIRRTVGSSAEGRHLVVLVRLWSMPAVGRSAAQMAAAIEDHRQRASASTFPSLAEAPLPEGAVLLASAFENPIVRRLGALVAELGLCLAYDATGARTEKLGETTRKTAVIGAPQTMSIPTVSVPIKILAMMMGLVIATFIALFSLNPYIFVYLILLIVMALSTRQVLVCDDEGLRLHYAYFMGLWRRGQDARRWDEVSAIQIESISGSQRVVAIRRVDGRDWKVVAPTNRAALALEAKLKGLTRSVSH